MGQTKILMLDTSKMKWDGITMVIYNYVSNMDRNNVVVDVAAINDVDPVLQDKFESLGCKFHKLTTRNGHTLQYIRDLAKLVKREKYDVVHIHCNSCTAAIDLLGAKLGGAKVRIAHSHNTECGHMRAHKLLRPMFDALCTDRFACGVEAGKWLFPNQDVVVLNNAVDSDRFVFDTDARVRIREQYGLDGKVAIGNVANFTEQKNHKFLLDFWSKLVKADDRYVLFLIGGGKLKDEVEAQIADLKIQDHVVLTGPVQNVPDYLSAMDAMVLPSKHEGLPLVTIEWQISGLKSLVSDRVTSECRLTDSIDFLPLDEHAWIKAIRNIEPSDVNLRKSLSLSNQAAISAAGFDIKSNADRLKKYYLDRTSLIKQKNY